MANKETFIGEAPIESTPRTPFKFKLKAGSVGAENLKDKSVTANKIADNAVGNRQLAANSVESSNIVGGAVTTDQLADNSITTAKIQNNAVTENKIDDGAVTTQKIASNAVTGSKITDNAITEDKIADNAITNSKIVDGTITGDKFQDDTIDGSKIKDNSVPGSKLADGAIGTVDIQDNTLSGSKLVDNSVDGAKLVDGAVTTAKLKDNSIDGSKIADGTIQSLDIMNKTISGEKLVNNTITGEKLADGIITNDKLADNSITGDKFLDESISGEKIQPNTIHGSKLEDNTVDGADIINGTLNGNKIADMSVDGDKLADDSIETRHIKSNTITGTKIQDDAIDSTKIRNGSLVGDNFADNAITNAKLQDDSIVNRNIATETLTGDKFVDNTITGDKIVDNTIPGSKIKDGTIENVDIKDNTLSGAKLVDNSISGSKIANNAITSAHLLDNSIPASKILDGTIESIDIKDGTLDGGKVKDNTITGAKLADNAITSAKLSGNSITTDKIVDLAVTEGKIATNAVTNEKISDGSITETKLGTGAVTTNKIVDNAITENKIGTGAVTEGKIGNSAVTNTKIANNAVTTDKIQDGAVTTDKLAPQAIQQITDLETQFQGNETTRQNNETTRIENETGRVSAESGRVGAETSRVSAETSRDTAETTRQSNETTRQSNETTRENNETTRQSNETQRQTNETNRTATASADHNTAVSDHNQAANDHTTAASDHSVAEEDHTQAVTDHNTAASDHTTATTDHTRAESDHTNIINAIASADLVFDISLAHASGGVLAQYADLAAALGANGDNVPSTLRKGGMSVKFVQSSDNKYVQYRLTADDFSTDTEDWYSCEENDEELQSQITALQNIVADLGTLAEGYIRVAGVENPALNYHSYKYNEQGGFGRESVSRIFYPCLVGTKLTGNDAQVGKILYVLKKFGAKTVDGVAKWEDLDGNLHAIDGSEGDVLICNIEPYYIIYGKHTIEGTEYDVFLHSLLPFTFHGIVAERVEKFGWSPDYCVRHVDADNVQRMHSVYNPGWNGSYAEPVGIVGKIIYDYDAETGEITETYDANTTVMGGSGGLQTVNDSLYSGEQAAMNHNPDTTKCVPFMNHTAHGVELLWANMLAEGGTFDAHNASLMGSGICCNDVANATSFTDSGTSADNGMRYEDKNGNFQYKSFEWLNSRSNVSFMLGINSVLNMVLSFMNPFHLMEAHRAVSYAIQNNVNELEWFAFEGNKYKYRSVSGFAGPSQGEMTCVIWKMISTKFTSDAKDPSDGTTSLEGNRADFLFSIALFHGMVTQVSPSWWTSGLVFTEDENGQYECYIERDQASLMKTPNGDKVTTESWPFEEQYAHVLTVQKGSGFRKNYSNEALMLPDCNANKEGGSLHTYVGAYTTMSGVLAPSGKKSVRGFRRGGFAPNPFLSPLLTEAEQTPALGYSTIGFGICCQIVD